MYWLCQHVLGVFLSSKVSIWLDPSFNITYRFIFGGFLPTDNKIEYKLLLLWLLMIFVTLMHILPDRTRRISPGRRRREKNPTSLSTKMAKNRQNQKTIDVFGTVFQSFYNKLIIFWWNTFNITVNYMLNPLLSVFDIFDMTTFHHLNSIW